MSGNTPHIEEVTSLFDIVGRFSRNWSSFVSSLIAIKVFVPIFGILVILLSIFDIKNKFYQSLIWFVPLLINLLAGIFLNKFPHRYIFPSLIFFIVWIIYERKYQFSKTLAQLLLITLTVSSLVSIWPQITTPTNPDMYSFTKASNIVIKTIKDHQLDNSNVAALASKDPSPLADTYRDYIRMNSAGLRASSEYDVSENLFVISTSDIDTILSDESFAMIAFKEAELKDQFEVENSLWKVYWFGY